MESPDLGEGSYRNIEFSLRVLVDSVGLLEEGKNLRRCVIRGSGGEVDFDSLEYILDSCLCGFESRGGTENLDLAYRIKINKGGCIPGFFWGAAKEEGKEDADEAPALFNQ